MTISIIFIVLITLLIPITYSMEDPNKGRPLAPTQNLNSTSFVVIDNPADPAKEPEVFLGNQLNPLLYQINTSGSADELLRKLNDALMYYQRLEDTIEFTHGSEVSKQYARLVALHIQFGIMETFLRKLETFAIEQETTLKLLMAIEQKINNFYKQRSINPVNLRHYVTSSSTSRPEQSREAAKRKRTEEPTFKKTLTDAQPSKQPRYPLRATNHEMREFKKKIDELKAMESDNNLYQNVSASVEFFNNFFVRHGFLNKYIMPYAQALSSKISPWMPEPLLEFIENSLLALALTIFNKNLESPLSEQAQIVNYSCNFFGQTLRTRLISRIEKNAAKRP